MIRQLINMHVRYVRQNPVPKLSAVKVVDANARNMSHGRSVRLLYLTHSIIDVLVHHWLQYCAELKIIGLASQ